MRTAALAALLVLVAPALHASAGTVETDAQRVARGFAFLARQDDLGASTAYALEAVGQSTLDPRMWPTPERSVYATLQPTPSNANDPFGPYKSKLRELHALGTAGYGAEARARALADDARAGELNDQFGDPTTVNDDMWAILALRAAGAPIDDSIRHAASNVRNARHADGGWSYGTTASPLAASDPDDTGMALAALVAAGENVAGDPAESFVRARHLATGGYNETAKPGEANCQATVWALHAQALLGHLPDAADLDALRSMQRDDGGFATSPGSSISDVWCTEEVLVLLQGYHDPLPATAPCALTVPTPTPALSPATLRVEGGVTDATWRVGGTTLAGAEVAFTPPAAGAYPISVLATGDHARCRLTAMLMATSAAPIAVLSSTELDALRHVPVAIDLSGSFDPDGEVRDRQVDWGDGTVDRAADHAYEAPGDRTIRARVVDDAGVWSAPVTALVHVADRAPILGPLPGVVHADRVHMLTLNATARDPDGDAVEIVWTLGDRSGSGAPVLALDQLGEVVLRLHATDPYGAAAQANVTILVENIPPTLSLTLPADPVANATLRLDANATDADGPSPSVAWRVDGRAIDGANVTLRAGDHDISATAMDADGASVTRNATLHVRLPDEAVAPPPAAPTPTAAPFPAAPRPSAPAALDPPRIVAPERAFAGAMVPLRVELPEGAASVVLDLGDGNSSSDASLAHAWARAGAYEIRATAQAADGRTSTSTLVLRVDAAPPPEAPALEEPLTEAQAASSAPTAPPPAGASRAAAVKESPGPGVLALALLLLAGAGTRRRRA